MHLENHELLPVAILRRFPVQGYGYAEGMGYYSRTAFSRKGSLTILTHGLLLVGFLRGGDVQGEGVRGEP